MYPIIIIILGTRKKNIKKSLNADKIEYSCQFASDRQVKTEIGISMIMTCIPLLNDFFKSIFFSCVLTPRLNNKREDAVQVQNNAMHKICPNIFSLMRSCFEYIAPVER